MAVGSSIPNWIPPPPVLMLCEDNKLPGRWLGVKLVVARVMNNKPKKEKRKEN
jgi:hypothetical protein